MANSSLLPLITIFSRSACNCPTDFLSYLYINQRTCFTVNNNTVN